MSIHRNAENLGYVKNFEKTLSRRNSDLIFLSDQGDVWFENKISDMERLLETHQDIYVLVADMVITDQDLRPTPYTHLRNHLLAWLAKNHFGSGCSTAIRRKFLDIVLPISDDLSGHDSWIHRLASLMDVKLVHSAPLQYYRRRRDNTSDSLTSRPAKTTSLAFLRAYSLVDASGSWRRTITGLKVALQRLGDRANDLERT